MDAAPGSYLMDPGKTYKWTTTVQSIAVTKPLTATVINANLYPNGESVAALNPTKLVVAR